MGARRREPASATRFRPRDRGEPASQSCGVGRRGPYPSQLREHRRPAASPTRTFRNAFARLPTSTTSARAHRARDRRARALAALKNSREIVIELRRARHANRRRQLRTGNSSLGHLADVPISKHEAPLDRTLLLRAAGVGARTARGRSDRRARTQISASSRRRGCRGPRRDSSSSARSGAINAQGYHLRRSRAPAQRRLRARGGGRVSLTRTALIADPQPMFRRRGSRRPSARRHRGRRRGVEYRGSGHRAMRLSPGVCVLDGDPAGRDDRGDEAHQRACARNARRRARAGDDDEMLVASVRAGASGYCRAARLSPGSHGRSSRARRQRRDHTHGCDGTRPRAASRPPAALVIKARRLTHRARGARRRAACATASHARDRRRARPLAGHRATTPRHTRRKVGAEGVTHSCARSRKLRATAAQPAGRRASVRSNRRPDPEGGPRRPDRLREQHRTCTASQTRFDLASELTPERLDFRATYVRFTTDRSERGCDRGRRRAALRENPHRPCEGRCPSQPRSPRLGCRVGRRWSARSASRDTRDPARPRCAARSWPLASSVARIRPAVTQ